VHKLAVYLEDPGIPFASDQSPLNVTPWTIFGSTKGILLTPKATITERGGTRAVEGKLNMSPVEVLVNLWRHECERVFCDKLTTNKVLYRVSVLGQSGC